MTDFALYNILWCALILFAVAWLFVKRRDQWLSNFFRKQEGFSPAHRWILYLLAFVSILLVLHTTEKSRKGTGQSGDQPQVSLQEWIAVLDVQGPELFQRALYLIQDEANAYRGIPLALCQAGSTSLELIVPPTYDLVYFRLILETLSAPKARQSADLVQSEALSLAKDLSDTPLVALTIFTDRPREYSGRAGDKDLQVIDVHPQVFQKESSEIARVRAERMSIGRTDDVSVSEKYALQYLSLLLTALATILFCQAFKPKSLFLLLFIFPLYGQDPSPLIQSAEVFYRQGDYQEASKILHGFNNENNPYVLWNIALCQAVLKDYDKAQGTLDQIERYSSSFKDAILQLREFILFEQLQDTLKFPDAEKLQNLVQNAATLSSRTAVFNRWLMMSACTLRSLNRLEGFTFPSAASVLHARVKQSILSLRTPLTNMKMVTDALAQEINAYLLIYQKTVPQHLFLLPDLVQTYCLGVELNKMPLNFEEALSQLDRFYLLALFLAEKSWENGVENLFSACIEASLWKKLSPFVLKKRREFLKGLLSSFNLPVTILVSNEESYAKAYEDLELFRILYPENNRFYNAILAVLNGDSIEVTARAFPILGLKDVSIEDRQSAKNQLLTLWVDTSSYPMTAVRSTCESFLARAVPMPTDQFQNSTLLDCLHLLINLPPDDGQRASARGYLERIAPFFTVAVARPFDINVAEALNSWFRAFVECMSSIKFNEADASQVKDAESAIQDALQVLQTLSGNSNLVSTTWNGQIRTILEKVQLLYELLQEPSTRAALPNQNVSTIQTTSMLFDPLQLYRTLELRDRKLREDNPPPKGGQS